MLQSLTQVDRTRGRVTPFSAFSPAFLPPSDFTALFIKGA